MNYYRIAQSKYKRAVRVTKLLRYVPGVKMIAVCNSLSYNRAGEWSDIDLFIITQSKRIWTARFFTILLLEILVLRPDLEERESVQNKSNNNKICLSFFISEYNLDLEKYKISVHDPYLIFWIKQLKPLYIEDDMYNKFVQANKWAFGGNNIEQIYIPNYKRRVRKSIWKGLIDRLSTVVDERIYRRIELAIMPKRLKHAACDWEPKVVLSDKILKLHFPDRRLTLRNFANFLT